MNIYEFSAVLLYRITALARSLATVTALSKYFYELQIYFALVFSGVLSSAAVLVGDAVQLYGQQFPVGSNVLVQRRLRVQGPLEQTWQ